MPIWPAGSRVSRTRETLTSWDRDKGVFRDGKRLFASFLELFDQRKVEPDALGLSRHVATFTEGFFEEGKVWSLEQGFGRSDRVGRISDDNIVRILVLGEEFEAVADENGNTGVLVAGRHFRKELLGYTDHGLGK